MMTKRKTTKQIGDKAELKAVNFLENKGYEVLERNYRSGRNEIDIISSIGGVLVFVEVKYRSSAYFGHGELDVDDAKLERIKEAAENYIFEIDWQKDIQFDVLAITGNEIFHFEDV